MITVSKEDYLKSILEAESEGEDVISARLADMLKVSPPAVTMALRRLKKDALVRVQSDGHVRLTAAGRKIARKLTFRHHLIERMLSELFGMEWWKVHDEAERLEHVISEDLESRIADKLGQPKVDPHGHPIPSYEGTLPDLPTRMLWEAVPGSRVTVARVSDRDPVFLAHLSSLSLVPGTTLRVVDVSPYNGTQTISVNGIEQIIGSELAKRVQVQAPDADGGMGR